MKPLAGVCLSDHSWARKAPTWHQHQEDDDAISIPIEPSSLQPTAWNRRHLEGF